MYNIIDITEDNLDEFIGYVGRDMAENIGRTYYAGIVACDDNNEPRGAMIWEYRNLEAEDDNESVIEWIRVEEDEVFGTLMDAYKERVLAEDVVLSKVSIQAKEGKELRKLLKGAGFDMMLNESNKIFVKASELSEVELMQKMRGKKIPSYIKPLSEISMRTFRTAISKCVFMGRHGLCEDLADLPIRWFDEEVSFVSETSKGINGLFLFHKIPTGLIRAQLLVCLDKSVQTTLPLLMLQFVKAMERIYEPDTLVEFDRHNEQVMLLTETLIPRGFGRPVYTGSRREN